ncbi:uncharacterized protein EDB91DRAFT_1083813 [Suillus paluster]|uniref:uncharacterized protein n=1 Tax=Suillus paluster TaxID=48578 RepID=UPI001B8763E3|nr:uncharacterized protein EDB91DRAFT_1083813 [Suillus paluster]KAG1735067.1 hypothetical protein EDB91DRAFT_1083813 [Suillus paluster]
MAKCKCTLKCSTFGSVQETVITDTGTSWTLRANLSKIRADRLAFERQQLDGQQGISAATQQLLAEAAIHANNYSNDSSSSFADFNASVDNSADKGSDIRAPVTGGEQHAVSAAQMHILHVFKLGINNIVPHGPAFCVTVRCMLPGAIKCQTSLRHSCSGNMIQLILAYRLIPLKQTAW